MCTLDVNAGWASSGISNLLSQQMQVNQVKRQSNAFGEAYAQNQEAFRARSGEIAAQTQQRLGTRALQAKRDLARLNTIQADSNLTGPSMQRLKDSMAMTAEADADAIISGADSQIAQTDRENRSTLQSTNARIANQDRPSVIGNGLQLFGGYMNQKGRNLSSFFDSPTAPNKKEEFNG